MCLALRASGLLLCYTTLQNVIPLFPWIALPHPSPRHNPREGRDQILPSSNHAVSSPSRFWGSYRPGVYFGLKTRSPADLLAGLMWMLPGQVASSNLGMRHWCDQNDGLSRLWLPDGYSKILRLYVFGPSGLNDYGSATLCCKI